MDIQRIIGIVTMDYALILTFADIFYNHLTVIQFNMIYSTTTSSRRSSS